MIYAYLNNVELKLFPEMAIGITIENFNISDMANRKIDRTNTIRVPKVGNEATFEFAAHPNPATAFVYDDYDFDLIVDGIKIYENGRAFITGEDQDSYTLNITNNKNIVDLLKSISLATLYEGDTVTLVNTTTWKTLFAGKVNGFKIDSLFGEEELPPPGAFKYGLEAAAAFSYLSIYIDTILTKIEADYDITFSGDLLTDADFLEARTLCVQANFKRNNGSADIYVDELIIHDSLTAWDLIKNILQLFCGVFKIDGTNMELQKFNDLDITNLINWTGKLVSSSKKFAIPDTAQKNYIRYVVAKDVDENQNSAMIECNNTNILYEKDLITMKAKLFPYLDVSGNYINASTIPLFGIDIAKKDYKFPGLVADPSIERIKGLKDFVVFIDSTEFLGQPLSVALVYLNETAPDNWVETTLSGSLTVDAETSIVKYLDPIGNYSLIGTMLTNPVFYEAELLLNILDIYEFTEPAIIPSNISDCENSSSTPYETFSGVSPTGFTAVNTVGAGQCGTADEIPFVNGEKWKVTFDLVLNSGELPYIRGCLSIDGSCFAGIFQAVEGANEITLSPTTTYIGVVRFSNFSDSDYIISNLVVQKDFNSFKAVRIDELEGIFYVNRISNFLATSPGTPTKVELIKIS